MNPSNASDSALKEILQQSYGGDRPTLPAVSYYRFQVIRVLAQAVLSLIECWRPGFKASYIFQQVIDAAQRYCPELPKTVLTGRLCYLASIQKKEGKIGGWALSHLVNQYTSQHFATSHKPRHPSNSELLNDLDAIGSLWPLLHRSQNLTSKLTSLTPVELHSFYRTLGVICEDPAVALQLDQLDNLWPLLAQSSELRNQLLQLDPDLRSSFCLSFAALSRCHVESPNTNEPLALLAQSLLFLLKTIAVDPLKGAANPKESCERILKSWLPNLPIPAEQSQERLYDLLTALKVQPALSQSIRLLDEPQSRALTTLLPHFHSLDVRSLRQCLQTLLPALKELREPYEGPALYNQLCQVQLQRLYHGTKQDPLLKLPPSNRSSPPAESGPTLWQSSDFPQVWYQSSLLIKNNSLLSILQRQQLSSTTQAQLFDLMSRTRGLNEPNSLDLFCYCLASGASAFEQTDPSLPLHERAWQAIFGQKAPDPLPADTLVTRFVAQLKVQLASHQLPENALQSALYALKEGLSLEGLLCLLSQKYRPADPSSTSEKVTLAHLRIPLSFGNLTPYEELEQNLEKTIEDFRADGHRMAHMKLWVEGKLYAPGEDLKKLGLQGSEAYGAAGYRNYIDSIVAQIEQLSDSKAQQMVALSTFSQGALALFTSIATCLEIFQLKPHFEIRVHRTQERQLEIRIDTPEGGIEGIHAGLKVLIEPDGHYQIDHFSFLYTPASELHKATS